MPGATTGGAPAGRGAAPAAGAAVGGAAGLDGGATGRAAAGGAAVGAAGAATGLAAGAGAAAAGRAGLALAAAFAASAAASCSASSRKCLRACSACSISSELECVFFSLTPISGRKSIRTLALISSSLASSLIRIWFVSVMRLLFTAALRGIRPREFPLPVVRRPIRRLRPEFPKIPSPIHSVRTIR